MLTYFYNFKIYYFLPRGSSLPGSKLACARGPAVPFPAGEFLGILLLLLLFLLLLLGILLLPPLVLLLLLLLIFLLLLLLLLLPTPALDLLDIPPRPPSSPLRVLFVLRCLLLLLLLPLLLLLMLLVLLVLLSWIPTPRLVLPLHGGGLRIASGGSKKSSRPRMVRRWIPMSFTNFRCPPAFLLYYYAHRFVSIFLYHMSVFVNFCVYILLHFCTFMVFPICFYLHTFIPLFVYKHVPLSFFTYLLM